MVNVSTAIYQAVLKIKCLKSKIVQNSSWKHYWEKVSFSRSRKHKPTKLSRLQNVTWKHILGLLEQFRQNCISLSVHSILLNKKHCLKCFRNLFEITHTDFFYSWIFLLPYMVNLEIGISFSITDLVCIKFMLYQFSFFFFGWSFPCKYRLP